MQVKEIKRLSFRMFWILEVLIFIYFYIFAKNGFVSIKNLELINKNIKIDILNLEKDIVNLKNDLDDWNLDNFNKIEIARKDLQFGYPDEEIFIIK